MIARRLRGLAVLQLLLLGLGALAVLRGNSVLALLPALLLPLGWVVLLGLECLVLLPLSARGQAGPAPGLALRLAAWGREVKASARAFAWEQVWREQAWPDRLPPGARAPGVLLVHGFGCNRGFWNPWLARLTASGVPFVALSLEPPWGDPDAHAPALEAAARRLQVATGQPPVVVAHSMGGVVVRAWLRARALAACATGSGPHVPAAEAPAALLCIASPHHGTWLAHFPWAGAAWALRRDSAWRQALAAHEAAQPVPPDCTCLWSRCDNVVMPADSACLPGARNLEVAGTPHVALAFHPQAWAWLDEARRAAALRSPAT